MPQAHTLAVPGTTRAPRLMPLIVIFTAAALFALAFVVGSGDSTPAPKEAAVAESPVSTAKPDESKIAAAISSDAAGPTMDSAAMRKWKQYDEVIRSLPPGALVMPYLGSR
jgi:hypothetical protein